MKTCAIIAAGGIGKRMNNSHGKQFIELLGKPIILRTILKFENSPSIDDIVVVIEKDKIKDVENLIKKENISKVRKVVAGGERRQDSVFNGIQAIDFPCDIVLVHDGARPLVDANDIEAVIEGVKQNEACIVASPVKDTLKEVKQGTIIKTPDRKKYWGAKTPQGFKFDLLKKAYQKGNQQDVTDDAMLVESQGVKVTVVPSSCFNIKITTPEDLYVAESILKRES